MFFGELDAANTYTSSADGAVLSAVALASFESVGLQGGGECFRHGQWRARSHSCESREGGNESELHDDVDSFEILSGRSFKKMLLSFLNAKGLIFLICIQR